MKTFKFNEKYLSQIPALQLLMNLGYEYITPEAALRERQGKLTNVILENILRDKLKENNRINFKGREYLFSEENIQSAIHKLKNVKYENLLKSNEETYDMLTLGTSFEQSIEGDTRSFTLRYIDWESPERNTYHVTAEYPVERTRSIETARPDIVLFVNGIPLVVIECKSPKIEIEQAVSQSIRNQGEDYIPKLFIYTQLVMGINKNDSRYATVGSSKNFWSKWKEQNLDNNTKEYNSLIKIINKKIPDDKKERLFSGEFQLAEKYFNRLETEGDRFVTPQDKALYSLCRPERLIELGYKYIMFEGGEKKIARYQQYFVVKSTLQRIRQLDTQGNRKGGIIWHTQGSGKSLTMVMLVRNLALGSKIANPRIVVVTDRDDLDKQLGNTFAACGLEPRRATSGRSLLELVSEHKAQIITTLIHKFDKAMNIKKYQDESSDIFMIIDESHRTQFGTFSARMRQMFPNACYLGFTGTPLMKKEKNNFAKFGGLIDPHYSINQAVEDNAVVPLLYEGRHVEMEQNRTAIDLWFERHTQDLTKKQKADLKKKYARSEMLNKADQVIYMRAFDISDHFRSNWQGTGFKAQLVAPGKESALKYHEYLTDIGYVTSEVIISPPDTREGYEEVDDEPADIVVKFWKKMMKRYGKEEEYTKQIINQFKNGDEPEILIVVDKLLTGFDAPRNTVLYLCRMLREHTLLQAIARVNRLYEKKDFGYIIDYASVLGELDNALTMYSALEDFDESDITGALHSINEEIDKLPQRYSDLWDVFKEVKNSYDEEAYEVLLADDAVRKEFYERLSIYSKTLAMALSAENFIMNTDEKLIKQYKADLKRFQNLRASVILRYAEAINYKDYEPKIKKLLDTHIQANEVIQLNEPVNIFDDKTFNRIKEGQGIYGSKSKASKADAIAHAMKRVITEKMNEDPAFYAKFSKLIQKAIDDYRQKRISDLDYFNTITDIKDKFTTNQHDDVPDTLAGNEDAIAFFGVIKPYFEEQKIGNEISEEISADTALVIQNILKKHWKVHFWEDNDVQKQAINDIDDYFFDEFKGSKGIEITPAQIDDVIEKTMIIARHRNLR